MGRTVAAFGFGGRSASSGGLLVLDAHTGKIIWQFDAGSGVEGGVALEASRAYFGDQLGRMHCLDLQTKAEVWQTGLEGGVVSTPLLISASVYIGTSLGMVAALDRATGHMLRAEKIQSQLVATQPMHVAQEPRASGDYLRILRDNLAKAFSLDEIETLCADLSIDFEDLGGEGKRGKARELIDYLDRRGRLNELVNLCEAQRPNVSWRATLLPTMSKGQTDSPARQAARIAAALVAQDSHVLISALDGGLYQFDMNQPGLPRKFDAGAALYAAPIITGRDGQRIILANHLGDVIALDTDTYHEMWRIRSGAPIRATPCLKGNTLYFGTHGRTLDALDVRDSRTCWQMAWRNSITTTPYVDQGRVVFGDTHGRIVCIEEATRQVVWEFDAQTDRPGLAGAPAAVFGGFVSYAGCVIFGAHNGCAYSLKV